jgi:hypothetical protein
MPRNYVRKTNRRQWTEDNLRSAALALTDETRSANSVATEFGIPLPTLLRRVSKNCLDKGTLGPYGCLGKENEDALVKHIQKLGEVGYAPTFKDVKHPTVTFAEKNKIKHKFNREKQLAGYDWFGLYMKGMPSYECELHKVDLYLVHWECALVRWIHILNFF